MAGNRVQVSVQNAFGVCTATAGETFRVQATRIEKSRLDARAQGAVLVEVITRLARPPRAALPFAAVSSKKTYAGRVRTAKPGVRGSFRVSLFHPEHARQRCAAMRGCRKSRNGHRRTCEMASGVRKIAPRRMHS